MSETESGGLLRVQPIAILIDGDKATLTMNVLEVASRFEMKTRGAGGSNYLRTAPAGDWSIKVEIPASEVQTLDGLRTYLESQFNMVAQSVKVEVEDAVKERSIQRGKKGTFKPGSKVLRDRRE